MKDESGKDQLLSPRELAELCKVPVATVYRWNYTGSGPRVLKLGKHVRYRQADVDRWLEQCAMPVSS